MNKLLLAATLFVSTVANAQETYWQQKLYYDIDVTLNETDKTLKGKEVIIYKNNSPTALNFIWLHIWPNAYKNDSTALYKQIAADKSRAAKLKRRAPGSM